MLCARLTGVAASLRASAFGGVPDGHLSSSIQTNPVTVAVFLNPPARSVVHVWLGIMDGLASGSPDHLFTRRALKLAWIVFQLA